MDQTRLAEQFEPHQARLRSIAYRMLGSQADAEDVVQEVWLRLGNRSVDDVHNLGGWLTTVTARICLDHLRSRTVRPEEPLDDAELAGVIEDPEDAAILADEVGVALLVVLETLAPAERLAFVLHDIFDVPFRDIGRLIDRSPDAAKMLASRGRRRVRDTGPTVAADLSRQRAAVDAFLAAARHGDMAALLDLLAPGVVVRADAAASPTGAPIAVRGARRVTEQAVSFARRAEHARLTLVDGSVGIAITPGDRVALVMTFALRGDRIAEIEIMAEPGRLRELRLLELDAPSS